MRFRFRFALFVISLSSFVAHASCSSDATSGAEQPVACSNGPARDRAASLPFVADNATYPKCVARCEYDGGGTDEGFQPTEAMPSGSCTAQGHRCSMAWFDGCGHQGVRCECKDAQWDCVLVSQ